MSSCVALWDTHETHERVPKLSHRFVTADQSRSTQKMVKSTGKEAATRHRREKKWPRKKRDSEKGSRRRDGAKCLFNATFSSFNFQLNISIVPVCSHQPERFIFRVAQRVFCCCFFRSQRGHNLAFSQHLHIWRALHDFATTDHTWTA